MEEQKDFVPYAESYQLNKFGYNKPCLKYTAILTGGEHNGDYYVHEKKLGLPLFSEAFRWFRDKHNIDAWVQPFVMQNKKNMPYLPDESYCYFIFKDGVFVCDKVDFLDPEDAELDCLRKLIEIVNIK